jgi:hypothetical protein
MIQSELTWAVHIAGPVQDNAQFCVVCGVCLIDYRKVAVMSLSGEAPSFWRPHSMIAKSGSGSFMMPNRALEADEQVCNALRRI